MNAQWLFAYLGAQSWSAFFSCLEVPIWLDIWKSPLIIVWELQKQNIVKSFCIFKDFLFSSLEKNKGIQMVSYCSLATSSLAPPIVPTLLWRWPQTAKHVHKWLDQLTNSKAPTIVNKISTGRAFTDRIQSLCCLWVSRPCQPLRPSCYEQVRLKGTNLRWFSRKKTWPEIWIDMWYMKQGQGTREICDLDV